MFSHGNTLPATENHQRGVSGGLARLWRAGDPSASPQEKKPWVCVKQPSKQWPRQLRTAGDGNAMCSIWPLHQAHWNKYKCFALRHWYPMKIKHLLLPLRLGESCHGAGRRGQWRKENERIWRHDGHADRKRLGSKCNSDTHDLEEVTGPLWLWGVH